VIPPLLPQMTFQEYMRALGKTVAAATPERKAQGVGALSFMLYAWTRQQMRSRVRQLNRDWYAAGPERLRNSFQACDLPMSAEHLVPVIHAFTDGLTFLRLLTPELITDDVIKDAFDTFAKD
jgi:hypothetical protein